MRSCAVTSAKGQPAPPPLPPLLLPAQKKGNNYCKPKSCYSACEFQTHHIALQHTDQPSNSSCHACCKHRLAILQVQDFATVVFRMKALGFNTVKLPFSFDALNAGSKRPFYDGCSSLASSDTLQKGLTEGGKGGDPFAFAASRISFYNWNPRHVLDCCCSFVVPA